MGSPVYEDDIVFDLEDEEPDHYTIIEDVGTEEVEEYDSVDPDQIMVETVETIAKTQTTEEGDYLRVTQHENILESNLADMPIFSFRRPSRKEYESEDSSAYTYAVEAANNVMSYEWTDSQGLTRGIQVVGSTRHGIPQFGDLEVLMAVTKASMRYNNRFLIKSGEFELPNKFYYTNSEVARILGYKKLTGPVNDRIETAIQRMMETTLYNYTSGGLWNAKTKEHETDHKLGYHIVENFMSQNYQRLKARGQKREDYREMRNYIILNQFFYESMCKRYFKIIDYDLFLGFTRSLTKRIYLIIHKWRGGKNILNIRYETLYARIPLEDDLEPRYKKRIVKQSMEELKESGYISELEYKPTYMTICLSGTYNLLQVKQQTFEELKERLVEDYDLTEIDIVDLFSDIELREGENLRYLQALINYCDAQVKRGYVTNRRRYILRGFTERYEIPRSYYP